VYGVYATRVLGEGSVGAFTHALSVVAFLQIAFGPINGTVAKFAAEYAARGGMGRVRSLVSEVARRVAAYGGIALVVASVAAFPLASFWKYTSPAPLLIALLITYATLILSVARGALRGLQRFGALNTNTIVESACRLAIGLALLGFWGGASVALLAYLIALVVTLALSLRQLRSMWNDTPRERVDGRAVRRFALPMFAFMLVSAGFQNIDMFLVKRVLPMAEADSYGVAFFLTGRAIAALVTPFTILLLPMLAHLHERGQSTRRPFLRVCGYFLLSTGIPLVLFGTFPGHLLNLLYGDRFSEAASVLFLLAIARILGHFCHIIGLARAAAGRFSFLIIYGSGFFVQSAMLAYFGRDSQSVVHILLWTQLAVLLALVLQASVGSRIGRKLEGHVSA